MPVIPALGGQERKTGVQSHSRLHGNYQDSLGYTVRLYLRKKYFKKEKHHQQKANSES